MAQCHLASPQSLGLELRESFHCIGQYWWVPAKYAGASIPLQRKQAQRLWSTRCESLLEDIEIICSVALKKWTNQEAGPYINQLIPSHTQLHDRVSYPVARG